MPPFRRRAVTPWLTGAILVAAALGFGGCSSGEDRFDEHLARAEGHPEAGEIDDGLLELKSALQAARAAVAETPDEAASAAAS